MGQKKAALPLFDEDALSGIQPSGSPWVIDNFDPATVPVPLQVVITSVEGPYTARDRKLWTFLLFTMWDKLGDELLHEISVREVNAVFRELGGDHNSAWIWESAKRLAKTTIEWEAIYDDERCLGIDNLFSAVLTKDARSQGRLKFHFPPLLIPIIKEPTRFARLRVHFLIKLSGKYAVTLYEILEGFVNRRDGECCVSMQELRRWLKVSEGTYEDWRDFRKRVLKPAVDQINADPLGAGFTVDYEPVRYGRKIGEIVFKLTKTDHRKAIDRGMTDKIQLAKKIDAAKATNSRPPLSNDAISKAQEATSYKLDMHEMQNQFWEHWESTGRPEFEKGVAKAFFGFCKHKRKALR